MNGTKKMGEMVNCATVFKHKFVFRNANMFLLSILIKKKPSVLFRNRPELKKKVVISRKGNEVFHLNSSSVL